MNDNSDHRTLSILLDDEPMDNKAHSSLSQAAKDRDFRETFKRYRMIGASIKGEQLATRYLDLAEAVSESLDSEPTVLAPKQKPKKSRWIQPLMGSALAASVAAVAIILGPQMLTEQQSIPEKLGPFVDVPTFAAVPAASKETHWKTLAPEAESELNELLEDHSEQSSWSRNSGIMPYTNFVSYDGR